MLAVPNQHQLRRPISRWCLTEGRRTRGGAGRARPADKRDSHDICFTRTGARLDFWSSGSVTGQGDRDLIRREAGEHGGSSIQIGQRRGLRLGTPAPDGQPRFVLAITPTTNTITVGPRDALAVASMSAIRPTWTSQPPGREWSGEVQVRAHGLPMAGSVRIDDHGLEVVLHTATNGVAPGQAVVLYEGSRVIGSATISATRT